MSYKRINKSVKDIKEKNNQNGKYKNNNKVFVRERKMRFTDNVWYLIMQKGRTTSMELDEYLKNKNGTYKISISKHAFSKQRQYLKPQIFIDIYKDYLEDFYHNYPEENKTYKGYNVCAIDGSLFEIPNTKELREEYKTQKNSSGDRLRKVLDKEVKEELKKQKTIKIRMSKVVLDTGEIEYLLTNITEDIIAPEEMKETYFKRWQIEIGYDILKNKLHLENFTGRTKITIEQDFYAQIYTFNVLQDIKNTNTRRIQEKQKNKNLKYKYKVNINILAGWLKNILIAVMFTEDEEEQEEIYNIIVEKAEKNLVAIIPNRTNIRKPYTSRRNKYKINLRNNM